MKGKKSTMDFIKKNGYYLIIGICALAIMVMSTFAIIKLINKPEVPPSITDPDNTGDKDKDKDKDKDDEGDKDDEVPVIDLVFHSPLSELEIVKAFLNGLEDADDSGVRYQTHLGIDLKGEDGDSVYAALTGTVSKIIDDGMGIEIYISHSGDIQTVYKCLTESKVTVGQSVKKGDVIGNIGETIFEYNNDGTFHLHFEVWELNDEGELEEVNPFSYLNISDK